MESEARVRWFTSPHPSNSRCTICGNATGNKLVLEAKHWLCGRGYIAFATCAECGSGYYPEAGTENVAYPASNRDLENEEFVLLLHHYLELVSGLAWKVPLLEQVRRERMESVLEIGCNVGVALDYCRHAWGVDAIGLEPSAYGLGGSCLLGVPIRQQYLDDAHDLPTNAFDLVFATEVIEHVHDPRAFLQSIRRHLSPRGTLLLTTPRIDTVSPTRTPGELYSTLSAGAHAFVLSEIALDRLLADAGFRYRQIFPWGAAYAAIASDSPIAVRFRPEGRVLEEALHRYYVSRCQSSFANKRVELAYHMLAFDTGVRACVSTVGRLLPRIDALMGELFWVSIDRPHPLLRRLVEAQDIFSFGRVVPYGLADHIYARAFHDRRRAGDLHALALLVSAHALRVDFQNLYMTHPVFTGALRGVRRSLATRGISRSGLRLLAEASAVAARVPELAPDIPRPVLWATRAFLAAKERVTGALARVGSPRQ